MCSHSLLDTATSLIESAGKHCADAADVVAISSADVSLTRRNGALEGLERSESQGVGLRVLIGAPGGYRQAIVSTTDTSPDTLSELAERAVAMARLAPEDPYAGLVETDQLAGETAELDICDTEEPDTAWFETTTAAAEDAALSVPGITNSEGANGSYGMSHRVLVTSHGFARGYRSSSAGVSVSVLAGEGVEMERDYDYATARHVTDLPAPESIGRRAAEQTVARLRSRRPETAEVPVVFDPRMGSALLSQFASAISGNTVARGTSFLKDAMGTAIFADTIRIVDDPLRIRGLASRPFDSEGVAVSQRALVENGVLQSWILDTASARQLGAHSTGHAGRGLASPPSPGASNLYMAPGECSPDALIADIQSGFYVTETFGMGVNLVTGDYSQGAAGFWIENGERAYPVSEVTIAGRMQDMFRRLTPANDLAFRYRTNVPTLRIERMTVAAG